MAGSEKAEGALKTISEVSDQFGIPQHILRYWETRFSHCVRSRARAIGATTGLKMSRWWAGSIPCSIAKATPSRACKKLLSEKGRSSPAAASPEPSAPVSCGCHSRTARHPAAALRGALAFRSQRGIEIARTGERGELAGSGLDVRPVRDIEIDLGEAGGGIFFPRRRRARRRRPCRAPASAPDPRAPDYGRPVATGRRCRAHHARSRAGMRPEAR